MITDKEIKAFFSRGAGELIDPEGSFIKKLKENPEKIVIKFGVDPTRPDIHLGHAVVLRWLRKMQDLGCKVIFLIGDVTSQIGDPTGKSKVRPELSQKEIEANMVTYLAQVGKILKVSMNNNGKIIETDTFAWIRNSDWFVSIHDIQIEGTEDLAEKTNAWLKSRMQIRRSLEIAEKEGKTQVQTNIKQYSFLSVLAVLRQISFNRLIERDMFQERLDSGNPVFMHEMMYPVMQGIDSNVIYDIFNTCDLEVGGTDQHFNMLIGRDVMRMSKRLEQSIMSFTLLEGLDGKEKMSKSLDNYVGITESADSMFGKLMSLPDGLIVKYFLLCTDVPEEQILDMEVGMQNGENPMQYKKRLAREIITIYHNEPEAFAAQDNWEKTFSDGGIPADLPEMNTVTGTPLIDVLIQEKVLESKAVFRRLIDEGAIKIMTETGEEKITDPKYVVDQPVIIKIGKKKFVKLVL